VVGWSLPRPDLELVGDEIGFKDRAPRRLGRGQARHVQVNFSCALVLENAWISPSSSWPGTQKIWSSAGAKTASLRNAQGTACGLPLLASEDTATYYLVIDIGYTRG